MIEKQLADKLTSIAMKQMDEAVKARKSRMKVVTEIEDIYFNKILQTERKVNIPFPIMSGYIDEMQSKIDNPPTIKIKLKNQPRIAEKASQAWNDDMTSMRAGWKRKDRLEKKLALFSGRGIAAVYAESPKGKYRARYDVVDYRDFLPQPTKSHIDDMMYCGQQNIERTKHDLEEMARMGVYSREQVAKLITDSETTTQNTGSAEYQDRKNRMQALGIDTSNLSFEGQEMYSLVQWQMMYNGLRYYLLFDPRTGTWVRAERLSEVFSCDIPHWVSWAINEDHGNFWSKGAGDDILPIAEAIRIIGNEALENAMRRNRPMRIAEAGVFADAAEIQDYVPDHVVISNPGRDPNIITIETPEITTSLNLIRFLDSMIREKTGTVGTGVPEDTPVGVFFGALQKEADRIGTVNKSYSESYAEKAYRYFWGLKDHLSKAKAIEMMGKDGVHWEELTREDLQMVGDVDDIVTSGGQLEEAQNEVQARRQSESLAAITANPGLAETLNPVWLAKTQLRVGGWNEEQIDIALDKENPNREQIDRANEHISAILQGKNVKLFRGATTSFQQHILDWAVNNLDYVKLDKDGNEVGIDERMKKDYDKLLAHAEAHVETVLENQQRELRKTEQEFLMQNMASQVNQVELPTVTQSDQRLAVARPFEMPIGTPEGTQQLSQNTTRTLARL